MNPIVESKGRIVLNAITDCNTNGATERYQRALTAKWHTDRAAEQAHEDFEIAARALRTWVQQRFGIVVGRQYYRETSVAQGYALAHDVRPPVIKPYVRLRAYARGGSGIIERTFWPRDPRDIERALRQIKAALHALEMEPS